MSADPRLDSQVAGLTAEVGAVRREMSQTRTDLGREIGQLRDAFSERSESLEEALERNTTQVMETNGKVRKHDMTLAEIQIRADERDRLRRDQAARDSKAEAKASSDRDRRDRWLLTFAGGSFTVVLAAGVALLVKAAGG